MMACKEWKERLLEYAALEFADGGPETGGVETAKERSVDARRVEAHIKGCAGCAAALAEMRKRAVRIDSALPRIAEGEELNEGFEARVFARIAAGEGARRSNPGNAWSGSAWLTVWRIRLAAAGVVCAVAVAAVVWPTIKKKWHIGEEPAFSISTWRSPTDGLLRTPGRELLQSGPKLGEVYFPVGTAARQVNK